MLWCRTNRRPNPVRRSFSRGSLERLDRNQKPSMKSLWHPGYVGKNLEMKSIYTYVAVKWKFGGWATNLKVIRNFEETKQLAGHFAHIVDGIGCLFRYCAFWSGFSSLCVCVSLISFHSCLPLPSPLFCACHAGYTLCFLEIVVGNCTRWWCVTSLNEEV